MIPMNQQNEVYMNRRNLLKALSCVPVIATFPSLALAKKADDKMPANLQSETEGIGKAMQYKHKAKNVKNPMMKKGSNCMNCVQYNKCASGDTACKPLSAAALKKAQYGPCGVFPGKVVDKDGWCMSWVKA